MHVSLIKVHKNIIPRVRSIVKTVVLDTFFIRTMWENTSDDNNLCILSQTLIFQLRPRAVLCMINIKQHRENVNVNKFQHCSPSPPPLPHPISVILPPTARLVNRNILSVSMCT